MLVRVQLGPQSLFFIIHCASSHYPTKHLKPAITQKKGLSSISISTCKSYSSLLKRLKEICSKHRMNDISSDEVDLTFYDDFKKFLLEGEITGIPGFNKHIQILKATMNLALDKGLHENRSFQHKLFRKLPYKTNKIYPSEDGIKRIKGLDLSEHQNLQAEKERFLLSYYFITRYGDSVKLRRNNFFEKNGKLFLRYFQVKTEKVCVVPVSDAALTILEKLDFDISSGTNQDSNRKLKTIGAMAGINTPTQEGGKAGPKWMFVTTHTARRSAATHLALQGVNLKLIADLGGWEKVETLRTYLRASGLDSAEVAKDLAFSK